MNAILQCLNQIEILTSYFLKEEHLKDLNETNPLGTGGELALAYGSVSEHLLQSAYYYSFGSIYDVNLIFPVDS
jgi:ubiquitin C-terminal hydrolase